MPNHRKIGFDENIANSCYQTASFVSLFLYPSKPIRRCLRQRSTRLKEKTSLERQAGDFLRQQAEYLGERQGQLSTRSFLRIRDHLCPIDYVQDFSGSGPNDIAEWTEAMLRLLNVPKLLHMRPVQQESTYILNVPIAAQQSVQQAVDNYFALNNPSLSQTPPLLLINLQRSARKTRLGNWITNNYRISLTSSLKLSVRQKQPLFNLASVVVMDRDRSHYAAYISDSRDWFYFSDIGGVYQKVTVCPDQRPVSNRHHISMLCNAHLLVYTLSAN